MFHYILNSSAAATPNYHYDPFFGFFITAVHLFDTCLADLISHATLRLLQPAYPLHRAWLEEKQLPQTVRAISRLYTAAIRPPPESSLDLDDGQVPSCCLSFSLVCL